MNYVSMKSSQRLKLSGVVSAFSILLFTGPTAYSQTSPDSLAAARQGFKTHLVRKLKENTPVDAPPKGMLDVVSYKSSAGDLAAYLSPDPRDGKKHPAIIWVFGGFDNGIGSTAWDEAPSANDQSARAFREAGLIMMYPSFRGGNQNPGFKEGFWGEVEDVLAAADFLAKQSSVDTRRIYLGGHSTGGTLVLLAAECSDRFRGVFAFGPVASVGSYGADQLPFDVSNKKELVLRGPVAWLQCIHSPVFVFEGTNKPSNAASVTQMAGLSNNPNVQFHLVAGASHFSILAPVTRLLADRIVHDDGVATKISFTDDELNGKFSK
jgi:alpha/beta superfamily hydrolase